MTLLSRAEAKQGQDLARGFLPEVQALRALAVLLVVLYHLWPNRLPGGYVGVDVFFVISGYLISSHLLGSLIKQGTIPLGRFWSNRVWRLLPASLLVLVACWIFTVLFAPVSNASNALKQIGAAAAYVLNWILAVDSVDYLARDNVPTIVQHYWSLSVEEQFYLLWPLALLLIAWTATRARRGRRDTAQRARWVGNAIAALIIISLAYSIITTHFLPARAYFDTFTRAWEFAAGGLLALLIMRRPKAFMALREHWAVRRLAAPHIIGLLLIAGSSLALSATTPFPSYRAALPVVGVLLIIAGGMPQPRSLAALVSSRPVQFVGDVSYSTYLWHWPLIVGFGVLVGRGHSFLEGLAILAGSLLLAWLTKKIVEDPMRRFGRGLKAVWPAFVLALIGALLIALSSMAVISIRTSIAEQQAAERAAQIADTADCVGANAVLGSATCSRPFDPVAGINPVPPQKDLDSNWCLTWFDEPWKSCTFGDPKGPNGTIAIVGDSHAAALTNPLGDYLRKHGWRLVTFTRFGCPGLSPTPIGLRAQTPETERACADWSARVNKELIERSDIDMVIFTAYESAYAQPESPGAAVLTANDIVNTMGSVADSGKKVVMMHDFAATAHTDVPTCVASSKNPAVDCSVTMEAAYPPTPFTEAAELLAQKIRVVTPAESTCDQKRCYGLVGNVVVYADDNHVSETFARSVMPYLGPALLEGRPLDEIRRSR